MAGRAAALLCALAAGCGLAAVACGKRGDPQLPLSRTPQPVTSLRLSQRGDKLRVTFTAPRATTGGLRLGVLEVELLRADQATAEARMGDIAKMGQRSRRRVAPGETINEDVALPPAGTIVRVAARALDGGNVSALSSAATLTVQPPLPAPSNLVAELKGETVVLRWTGTIPSPLPSPSPSPSPSPAIGSSPPPSTSASPSPSPSASPSSPSPGAMSSPPPGILPASPSPSPSASPTPKPPARGFLVYRRADPAGSYADPLRSEPLTVNTYEDRAVSLGQRWCYVVGTVVSTEPVIESARTAEACVSVRDIVPPASPAGVAALGGADGVEVSWSPSSEADLASYRVYRTAPGQEGPPTAVGEVRPPETSWRDTSAAPGTRYVYTVTALDRAGNESPPSLPAPGGRP